MSATREQVLAMVLAAPGGVESLLRQYDVAETIAILRCAPGFLERQLKALYRQKLGWETRFDVVDILMIKELYRVDPTAPSSGRPARPPRRPSPPPRRPGLLTGGPVSADGGRGPRGRCPAAAPARPSIHQ
jgi:hypothetical protein